MTRQRIAGILATILLIPSFLYLACGPGFYAAPWPQTIALAAAAIGILLAIHALDL